MNRILHLIRGDLKQITRDPMLAFSLLGPLLLAVALRFGVPFAAEIVRSKFGTDISGYYHIIVSFMILLTPLILGMLSGFLILDERDENLINYFAVTPLAKRGYFMYRLSVPILLSAVCSMFLLLFIDLVPFDSLSSLLMIPMLALEAPIITLFLVAFASNKVEGLALSKAAGLIIFAPALIFVLPMPWQLIAGIVPAYWISKTFLLGLEGESMQAVLCAVMGIMIHLLYLRLLMKRFLLKVD